jgi:hypothetical protein
MTSRLRAAAAFASEWVEPMRNKGYLTEVAWDPSSTADLALDSLCLLLLFSVTTTMTMMVLSITRPVQRCKTLTRRIQRKVKKAKRRHTEQGGQNDLPSCPALINVALEW